MGLTILPHQTIINHTIPQLSGELLQQACPSCQELLIHKVGDHVLVRIKTGNSKILKATVMRATVQHLYSANERIVALLDDKLLHV